MLNMLKLYIFATVSGTSQNAAAAQRNPWGSLIFMVAVLIGLILLMVIPQKKREKQAKQMMDAIKPGTRIRTIGGIYGTVTNVKEDLVTIVSGPDDVKLVFVKAAIATIESDDSSDENTQDTDKLTDDSTEAKLE